MYRFFFVGLLLVLPAIAQVEESAQTNSQHVLSKDVVAELALPDAPSVLWAQPVMPVAAAVTPKSPPEAPTHAFFDRSAKIRFGILAGLIAADGITTQHVLNTDGGKEVNPLARPFVKHGAAGQLAASSLGYAFGIGGSYLFHRTNHHKLERIFQNVAIAVEGQCFVDNLVQSALTNRSRR
jgi:hypothetical protein